MKLWIDAAAASPERVFGMSLIERHLKAARHQKIELTEVIVDVGSGGAEPDFAREPRLKCPVRVTRTAGTAGQRLAAALGDEPLLVTDAASLVDARLYGYLGTHGGSRIAAVDGQNQGAVIARIEPGDRPKIAADAATLAAAIAALPVLTQAEFPAFIRKLRRSTPYYLFRVDNPGAARAVERFLFWSNYKGSTDFFTKYVYPPLVWLLVPPLARARVHPNTVTAVSIFLTLIAVPLFATGHFLAGFLCAYGMSVLDSVDGKLARLTFTDSWIGNILDHGLDLVHPPFWYLAWALGLTGGLTGGNLSSPAWTAGLVMLGLYVLDRLILAIYPRRFHKGLHTHAPIDGFVRTFISRRNINLPLFTVGYYIGLGVPTLYLIVVWQALTCLYHGGRTFWIFFIERARPSQPA
ncbi:MAG TPA: CDP-alcohol phosphatidyltransferase family protein [Dongiaceae bacterium]|nr:CDP-alcohol phosphatidyltransferase family protein [Dongiaceae bacterium]